MPQNKEVFTSNQSGSESSDEEMTMHSAKHRVSMKEKINLDSLLWR